MTVSVSARMRNEETDGVYRVDRSQHARIARDLQCSEHTQGAEPQHHDRAEHAADTGRSRALDGEEHDQHRQRQGNHETLEVGRHHLEPLDRRQDRDGRRNHAVTVKHGGAEQAQRDCSPGQAPRGRQLPQDQRQQREDASFAAIVRAQNDQHILDRNDERHRPEDHRQDTQDTGLADPRAVIAADTFLECVQRAGSDVAVDNAQRRNDQRRRHFPGLSLVLVHGACLRGGVAHDALGYLREACAVGSDAVNRKGRRLPEAMERVKGIEPSYAAWEAAVLPLNYTRSA